MGKTRMGRYSHSRASETVARSEIDREEAATSEDTLANAALELAGSPRLGMYAAGALRCVS
jgi:hypothetical protein